jgi:hypothetical protein
MVSMPDFAGFLAITGLMPENRKIGANMMKIRARAKQKPLPIFSQLLLCWNSGLSFLPSDYTLL